MAPFGYGLWTWFKGNPIAQWIAGIIAALALLKLYGRKREGDGVRKQRRKSDREARALAEKIVKGSKEDVEQVQRAAERVPDSPFADSLSDAARAVRISRDRRSGDDEG